MLLRCVRQFIPNRTFSTQTVRLKKAMPPLSQLLTPVPVKPSSDDINVGAELTGRLNKEELVKTLAKFYQRPQVKAVAIEYGLDSRNTLFFFIHRFHAFQGQIEMLIAHFTFRLHLPPDLPQL